MRRSGYFAGLAGGPRAAAGALGPPRRPGIDRGRNPSEPPRRAGSPPRPSFLSTAGRASADVPTLTSHPSPIDSPGSPATAGARTLAFHPPEADLAASDPAPAGGEASRRAIVAGLPPTPAPPVNPSDRVRPETIDVSLPQPVGLWPPPPPAPSRAAPGAPAPAPAAVPGPPAAETRGGGVTDGEPLPVASVGPPPGSPKREPAARWAPVQAATERPGARAATPPAPAPTSVAGEVSVAVPAPPAAPPSGSGRGLDPATAAAVRAPVSPAIVPEVDPTASARTTAQRTLQPQVVAPARSVHPTATAPPRPPEAERIQPAPAIRADPADRHGELRPGPPSPAPRSPRAEPPPRETAPRPAETQSAGSAGAQVRIGTIDVTVIPPSPPPLPATPAPVAGAGFTADTARTSLSLPVAGWYGMAQR